MTTIITLVILVLVIFTIMNIPVQASYSYGCFKGCLTTISLIVILCIGLYTIAGFAEKTVSYTVTNVNVQRIDIDDSTLNGKVLYLVRNRCKLNPGHDWATPTIGCRAGIYSTRGNTEHIEDIYIQDSVKNKLNAGTEELNINGIHSINDDSSITFYQNRGLDQIKDALKSKHLDGNDNYYLFYVNEGTPLPAYFTLHFKERDIRVKINNTPVKYKTN